MPIHDQGYRRYAGQRAPRGQSWMVIMRAGIRTFLAKRAFLGLLLLGWVLFFYESIKVYLAINVPAAATNLPPAGQNFLAVNAETFRDMIDSGLVNLVVFIITVYVGAGLIANDRRANALQIYLSKPLTRVEYVFGKLAILVAFLLFVTWIPAIALLIVQIVFAGNVSFLSHNFYVLPAITVFAFVKVTAMALAMLALSSLSNSSRYVGILFTALTFFTSAVYGVLAAVTRSTMFSWVSFSANLSQLGDVIFRIPKRYDTPWPISAGVVIVVIAVSVFVLERRVRGVEVVS
ncbi:MAG TPA: ABC transporter permease subunit [Vicinamibacterales bacterium]|jgi:ABC-2 type transport system permease protein|nr:ABC transporter permease subunit [Vicinamibacterales bacterium]